MQLSTLYNWQFLRFILGGVLSALIDIGTLQFLIFFKFDPFVATSVGFVTGLIFNYFYHVIFTFGSKKSLITTLRFLVVVGMNYLITLAMVYLSFYWLHIGVLPGKVASLPLVAINGFVLCKHWVFK